MRKITPILFIIAFIYLALPTVSNLAANLVSKDRPAPWERVVGLYFPTGASGKPIESPRFSTLQQCRNWTAGMSAMHQGYGRGGNASWVCGWGIIRADSDTGLPKMRDFIQGE
jgi:hypothetical protein